MFKLSKLCLISTIQICAFPFGVGIDGPYFIRQKGGGVLAILLPTPEANPAACITVKGGKSPFLHVPNTSQRGTP